MGGKHQSHFSSSKVCKFEPLIWFIGCGIMFLNNIGAYGRHESREDFLGEGGAVSSYISPLLPI